MTTQTKIMEAAADIGLCVGETLLKFREDLGKKYGLSQQQLAVALTLAQLQLLAASVAGILVGPNATEETMLDRVNELIGKIQAVIGQALEIPDV